MTDVVLALGGGGVKGAAHLGVIHYLEKHGYKIRAVAGTSAGGLVGALYASGLTTSQIADLFRNIDQSVLYRRCPEDGPSLLGLAGIAQLLTQIFGERDFSALKIPYACLAVDAHTGKELYLSKGSVMDAVLATIAVPGIFPPKMMDDCILVDGGVLNPVPVSLARWLAPSLPVVAVVLSPTPEEWANLPPFHLPAPATIPTPFIERISRMRFAQAFNLFVRSAEISSFMLTELRLKIEEPEVVIRPDVTRYSFLDKVDIDLLMDYGERAAERALPDIQRSATWKNRLSRFLRRRKMPVNLTYHGG